MKIFWVIGKFPRLITTIPEDGRALKIVSGHQCAQMLNTAITFISNGLQNFRLTGNTLVSPSYVGDEVTLRESMHYLSS